MLKEHTNPKIKGTVGLGHAIAYFTRKGMMVALPLNDSQPYDLIVEIDNALQKVQVKTSTSNAIALRTMGGNQSYHTAKLFDHSSCDYVYGLLDNGDSWLVPTSTFSNKTSLKLTDKKYDVYKL
jgi:hypothetical protein